MKLRIMHNEGEVARAENHEEADALLPQLGFTRNQVRYDICPVYMDQVYWEICRQYFPEEVG